ncbi:V-set and immunoglobulin domain-containing protein 1-like [Salvelinus namaycush]|uniref:V-set and immunoglobulin domain-containing protein 1-like n=1 Tax=Salvelinus namaycush TaxID=8040 RepID=UPI001900E21A|nr:V-set and immunoglobulin domain-containing protein 1-like [Salvelinus namaycush]
MVMLLLKCLLLFYLSFNELTTAAEAILWVKTGEKFTRKCSTTLKDQNGMFLYVGLDREVLYYYQRNSKLTPREGYRDRVKTEGPVDQLTITISNLTIEDTGFYRCIYTKYNETTYENDINQGRGSTLVVVNANEKPCPSGVVNVIIISILTILLCVIFLIWVAPRVKRCCNFG